MKNKSKTMLIILTAVAVLVAPLLITNAYALHLLIMVGIYILLTQGLNLILGYLGLLSLGQQAYLAIGAYSSALLSINFGWSFWLTLPIAIIITVAFGLFFGYITLRLKGPYFVIVTIGFSEIVRLLVLNIDSFGGPPGLRNIPAPSIHIGNLINFSFQGNKIPFYYLIWILAALSIYIAYSVVHSHFGRAFKAIRENDSLAQAVGINTPRFSMLAFVIAVSMAGAAGAYFAHYISHISPEIGAFYWTLTMLIMVSVGGQGTILGPILGAVIFTFVPELLRAAEGFRLPIYGLILMVTILFLPNGIKPLLDQILSRVIAHVGKKDKELVNKEGTLS